MLNHESLLGIWKLVSYEVEIQETGEILYSMGKKPSGFACFTKNNHVMVTLTGDERRAASNDQERAHLLNTIVSYAGTYRIEGNEWVTSVRVAWNPEWVNTEQRRRFEIQDNALRVFTTWRVMPNWADKGMQRTILTFSKVD
jgi:Lipocalin-like domain